jgi:hypothetical protein
MTNNSISTTTSKLTTAVANPISIPFTPESIVDFAGGLSPFFLGEAQERKYGEDLKRKWNELAQKYKSDLRASCYLDNVYAVMSGTVCSLTCLRQQVADQFKFLEELNKRRTRIICQREKISDNGGKSFR